MTTRQRKWLEIGIAFEVPRPSRTTRQGTMAYSGLCYAAKFSGLFIEEREAGKELGYLAVITDKWWWPSPWNFASTRQCDYERATFAYFMAALSDNDYEEMVR